jgi:hypothetical protein
VAAAGITYISSGVSDSNRTLGLPWDEFWVLAVGLQRPVTPALQLFANLTFVQGADGRIDQQSTPLSGRVVGRFDRRNTYLLDLSIVWRR